MGSRVRSLFLLSLLWCSPSWSAGWVAFIAPDIDQGRALFEEFRRLAAPDLEAHQLELRFVAVENVPDGPGIEGPVAKAVRQGPRVVLAAAERVATHAKRHTSSIPIIFGSATNPVRAGLVSSLARPGANVTGFTSDIEIERKQLELLKEVAPRARRVGVLNDGTWYTSRVGPEQVAAYERELGLALRIFTGTTPEDMARIVLGAGAREVDAWLVPVHNLTGIARDEVVRAINTVNKPAVYGRTFFVEAGGLMSYQEVIPRPMAIWAEMFRMILGGTPPGDIPVRMPRDFVLAVNVAQAQRAGMPFPPALLRRADKVVGMAAPTR